MLSLSLGLVLALAVPQFRQGAGYFQFLLLSRLGLPSKWLYDLVS
jgi:hypothetical protein